MPASTACLSIRSSSSAVKGAASRAARLSSSCATLLAPISTDVTRGSRNAHANAICASVWPRASAISLSARTWVRVCSVSRSGESDASRDAREPSGMPSRYLPVSIPWASGENAMQPTPGLPQHVEQVLLDPAVQHRVRGLVDQQRRAELAQDRGRLPGALRPSTTRCPRTAPCPRGRRRRARPSSPPAVCRGRTGGCRRCRRSPRPCAPATGRGSPGGTCASRRPARTGPATCRSPPWWRGSARRGRGGSPARRSCRSCARRCRRAGRSCWPGRSG